MITSNNIISLPFFGEALEIKDIGGIFLVIASQGSLLNTS